MLQPDATAWCYSLMRQPNATVWCYSLMLQPDATAWFTAWDTVQPDATDWYYIVILQPDDTAWFYGLMLCYYFQLTSGAADSANCTAQIADKIFNLKAFLITLYFQRGVTTKKRKCGADGNLADQRRPSQPEPSSPPPPPANHLILPQVRKTRGGAMSAPVPGVQAADLEKKKCFKALAPSRTIRFYL
jgi:hypothetical protein